MAQAKAILNKGKKIVPIARYVVQKGFVRMYCVILLFLLSLRFCINYTHHCIIKHKNTQLRAIHI